jgi:Beta-galactosidase
MSNPPARRWTRRKFTQLSLSGFGSLMATSALAAAGLAATDAPAPPAPNFYVEPPVNAKRPRILGTTFSPLQCHYLGLDSQETFRRICALGFDRIRLCAYWHEIERSPNQFDFSGLDWLLEACDRYGTEVVLAVGMKVPRWPEFHFPDWFKAEHNIQGRPEPIDTDAAIADLTLRFTEKVVSHTRLAAPIKYWQIENEPFTKLDITAGRHLSYGFVQQEVSLVRTLARADQKIALTGSIALPGADNPDDDRAFRECLRLADAVGINVYTKVPIGPVFYLEPKPVFWQKLQQWQADLVAHGKEAWIAESQAEPWEHNQLVAMNKFEHFSSSPKQTTRLVSSLSRMGYSTVLLWGCEYWYWQKKNGHNLWWWSVEQMVRG